jgi:hypothetical protein
MATQFIQIFSDATKIPADRPNAAGVGIVNGTLTFNGTTGAGLAAGTGVNLVLKTTTDSKPVLINSRAYTQATGDSIGIQSKVDQTVASTGSVYGMQISPRVEDAITLGGSLSAIQAAPIFKGAAGTITGDVRAFEAALDLNVPTGTRTVTGVVSALYAYLQAPSAGTYTGGAAVIHVPVSDQKPWDYLLLMPTTGQFANTTASLGAQIGQLLVKIGGTVRCIPYYATS